MVSNTCQFIATMLVAASIAASAQSPSIAPGAIRCADCAVAGQKAAPSTFDSTKTEVIARIAPSFIEERTLRISIIARVLGTSPVMLEVLDSRVQHVNRQMAVVRDDIHGGKDPATCGLMEMPAVSQEAKALLPTLAFNDVITGVWLMQRDPRLPESPLDAKPVLSEIRKISGPVEYFHPTPGTVYCANRSGRLIEYVGPTHDGLTVYNDGAIHYRDRHVKHFNRQRLSASELADLLGAFNAASFDTLPPVHVIPENGTPPTLTLIAARYQVVQSDPPDARLAPVVERIKALTARAMSDVRLVLKARAGRAVSEIESARAEDIIAALRTHAARTRVFSTTYGPNGTLTSQPVDLEQSPELVHLGGTTYSWSRELGFTLMSVPPEGRTISREEYEKHKGVYHAFLNAWVTGLNLIEDGRLFEGVRLCQIEPGSSDDCASR